MINERARQQKTLNLKYRMTLHLYEAEKGKPTPDPVKVNDWYFELLRLRLDAKCLGMIV